jgi:hypothetical protein
MIPIIERPGGRVLVRCLVTEILTSASGQALGVRVQKHVPGKNQSQQESFLIRAKKGVISGAGYPVTRRLVKNKIPPPPTLVESAQHITLFLGFEGETEVFCFFFSSAVSPYFQYFNLFV